MTATVSHSSPRRRGKTSQAGDPLGFRIETSREKIPSHGVESTSSLKTCPRNRLRHKAINSRPAGAAVLTQIGEKHEKR